MYEAWYPKCLYHRENIEIFELEAKNIASMWLMTVLTARRITTWIDVAEKQSAENVYCLDIYDN